MRSLVCLSVLFFLCGFAKKPEPVLDLPQAQKEVVCPVGIGSSKGDQPLLRVQTQQGFQMMVCGYDLETEYDIYQIFSNGDISSSLFTASSLSPTRITQENQVMYLTSLLYYRSKWVPAFVKALTCAKSGCEVAKQDSCVFQPSPTPIIDWSALRPYQEGEKQAQHMDEKVLVLAMDAALSGDTSAQNIFLKQRNTLRLDGATAELFTEATQNIERLKKHGCL